MPHFSSSRVMIVWRLDTSAATGAADAEGYVNTGSLLLSLIFSHFAELNMFALGFIRLFFQASFSLLCTSFAIIVPYVNLSYFNSYEQFFHCDFSCDVLDARVQVLWKGWSSGNSAQTVVGGDGEGKS